MLAKVLLLLQYFVVVYCYTKPDKPCRVTDDSCITQVVKDIFAEAIAADPKAGFESIDPMYNDEIVANLPSVNFTLTDCTLKGFKDLQVLSSRVSTHDSVYINFTFRNYELSGQYNLSGYFLTTPLYGNGNFTLKASNINVYMEAMKQYYKKDDKGYLKIKGFEFQTELKGKINLEADNLFNGNKELADSALELLNSNGKVFISVWNPPATTVHMKKLFVNVNKILGTVPLNHIVSESPKSYKRDNK